MVVHFAMHKIPVLWRLHRVHHSDTELDVSSAVRFHPLEFAVQVPVSLATIVAFGVPPVAIILYELLDAFMAVWTHANIRLPLGVERIIGTILVTPSMHRIHHSSHWLETDSNYGATLSIWDRLFRTLRDKSHAEQAGMELGLEECQDARSRNFLWLLILPFIRLLALRKREGQ
jgi:sterol desaturase/sphingolipid hydroxylase (fatty acid hydroxylase superfamily)